MATDLAQLRAELERRATFQSAVLRLTAGVQAGAPYPPVDLFTTVARVATLLKARFQNVGFWRSGAALFQACQVHASFSNT